MATLKNTSKKLTNLETCQRLWREDEPVLIKLFSETVNGKTFAPMRRVLPTFQTEESLERLLIQINDTFEDLAKKQNKTFYPKDISDIKTYSEDCPAHLHIENMSESKTIRYSKTSYVDRNCKHFFYVDDSALNSWQNLDYVVFVDKEHERRFLINIREMTKDVVSLKPDNNGYDFDTLVEKGYVRATWYWNDRLTRAEVEVYEEDGKVKNITVIDDLKKEEKYFMRFDRAKIGGRRDTSRAFKVYKDGHIYKSGLNSLTNSITSFTEKFCEKYGGDKESVAKNIKNACNLSLKKYENFKRDGSLPRTKKSFGKEQGMYFFDNSWEDSDILDYMEKMLNYKTAKEIEKEAEEKKLVEENNKKYIEENYDPEDKLGLNWWIDKVTNTEEETTWKDTSNKTKVTFAGTQLPPLQRQKSCLAL